MAVIVSGVNFFCQSDIEEGNNKKSDRFLITYQLLVTICVSWQQNSDFDRIKLRSVSLQLRLRVIKEYEIIKKLNFSSIRPLLN